MPNLITKIYEKIDAQVAVVEAPLSEKLRCKKGCNQCCVDDISVFDIEAENIRQHFSELLIQGTPHSVGQCAFLGEAGECRIYAQRPYVCRTQGVPLRWFENLADGETVEYRDICPLNEAEFTIENLASDECWTLGPMEGELAELQRQRSGEPLKRTRLRDLFVNK